LIVPQGDKVLVVHRNREKENEFLQKIQNLHSGFVFNEESSSLVLKGTDVLKNNWFFLFVDAMKDMKTPVFGFEALKNFRFNTAKPQTKMASHGGPAAAGSHGEQEGLSRDWRDPEHV